MGRNAIGFFSVLVWGTMVLCGSTVSGAATGRDAAQVTLTKSAARAEIEDKAKAEAKAVAKAVAKAEAKTWVTASTAADTRGDSGKESSDVVACPVGETVFHFRSDVDEDSVTEISNDLEDWLSKYSHCPNAPVRIDLNSQGGNVAQAFSFIDEIGHVRRLGHKVTIAVYGLACSAASFIMQSADHRVIGANSWIMIHEISVNHDDKLTTVREDLELTTLWQDQFLGLIAAHSKLTVEQLRKQIDRGHDWWIPANKALELGLVDEVEVAPPFKK